MNTGELSYKVLSGILAAILLLLLLVGWDTENGKLILSAVTIPSNTTVSPAAWEDLRVPLSSTRNPSSAPGYDTFVNGTKAWAFDKASDEMLYFETQLPHNYKLGTTLVAHIHWAPLDTGTNGVVWCLEYSVQYVSGGAFPATTTDCGRQVGAGTALGHQLIAVETVAAVSGSISAVLVGRLFRDADSSEGKGTDDYDNDAFGLSFDIHYQVDGFGSTQETTK